MNFEWADAERALHDSLADYGARRFGGLAGPRSLSASLCREAMRDLGSQGVLAMAAPPQDGGPSYGPVACVYGLEGLGYGCHDNGLLFAAGAHMWAVLLPLLTFGSEDQKREFGMKLVAGELVGAHAMTEVEAGSDTSRLRTTARRNGEYYHLDGYKRFITNAPIADVFLIYATLDPEKSFLGHTAFLVTRDTPGLHVETEYRKSGLRSALWGEIRLEDCRVPISMRLGREREGSRIFAKSMSWERTMILAPFIGTMRRQIEECVSFARGRRQFGRLITKNQAVSNRIVAMQIRLESARLLTYRAASELGRDSLSPWPEIAQLEVSEALIRTMNDALETFGGYGFSENAGVMESFRDALGTRISSGTSDMQHEVIARKMGLHEVSPARTNVPEQA